MELSILSLARIFLFIMFATASFDVFLAFDIGATIRATQLALMVALLLFSIHCSVRQGLYLPVGSPWIFAWCLLLLVLSINAEIAARGAYSLWAILDELAVVVIANCFSNHRLFFRLIEVYLLSFCGISLFSILQFLSPLLGLPSFLVQEWYVEGWVARANGFSYEPSYLATYLLIGWSLTAYAAEKGGISNISRGLLRSTLVLSSAGLLVSTSKLGIALAIVSVARFVISKLVRIVLRGRASKKVLLALALILTTAAASLYGLRSPTGQDLLPVALAGLGYDGGASHSVSDRYDALEDTLTVFQNSPVFGVGLGSVAEQIAINHGATITSAAQVKDYEGLSVFFEAAAGSGVVGVSLLLLGFIRLAQETFVCSKRATGDDKLLGQALLYSFGIELVALAFSPTILRPYLWYHLGILAAYCQGNGGQSIWLSLKKTSSARAMEYR